MANKNKKSLEVSGNFSDKKNNTQYNKEPFYKDFTFWIAVVSLALSLMNTFYDFSTLAIKFIRHYTRMEQNIYILQTQTNPLRQQVEMYNSNTPNKNLTNNKKIP